MNTYLDTKVLDKMLFKIPKEEHEPDRVKEILKKHEEIRFVSFVGVDLGGHDTDAKIPVKLFLEDLEKFYESGVQTDGSSVVLPKIAALNNARVDIIPDRNVDWFVDYNFMYRIKEGDLPIGTLRIPSMLVHNDTNEVGSRVILKKAADVFKRDLTELIAENPYILKYLPFDSADDIEEIILTSATELEFWVKTPEEKADREQLYTSQELKEQYWQRTRGPVRTAMEETLIILDYYGFNVEMGHKEVGGIKAKLSSSGEYDHIMEQLEIDWKYSEEVQTADNDLQIRYIVKDIFKLHGLEVSFMAKPMDSVAGSGKHTHMGVAARLKDGSMVSLFAPKDKEKDFLNPIGYGALMGILKNYEVINPFVTGTNDAINRLKPGFEAPVCVVTSLGQSVDNPSRNRTVLLGLVRDINNPLSTRFELRSPNPKSNTYLVLASGIMAMLDGISQVLSAGKTPAELEKCLSKGYGEEAFYLEKDRVYRSELNVFDHYSQEERNRLFGKAPETIWENIIRLDREEDKIDILLRDGVFDKLTIDSYKEAILARWAMELHNRVIPDDMAEVRKCVKLHDTDLFTSFDQQRWDDIMSRRRLLGVDSERENCLLTKLKKALDKEDYSTASDLQIVIQKEIRELRELYDTYRRNIL